MLPFELMNDLSVTSQEEVTAIIEEMRKAIANDDNNDGASEQKPEVDKNSPTLSR